MLNALSLANKAQAKQSHRIVYYLGDCEGFFFGRFDIRVPSRHDFMAGRNIKIVKPNGVTSDRVEMDERFVHARLLDPWPVLTISGGSRRLNWSVRKGNI